MVPIRRSLKYFALTLVFVLLLSACVRPLAQDDSEEASEATRVAEEAALDEEAGQDEEQEQPSEESTGDEAEAESPREDEPAEVTESEEAQSTDPDVGGGTPDSAEEEPAEEADSTVDESETEDAAEEEATEESTDEPTDEAATEESTDEEAAEQPVADEPATEEAEVQTTIPATHVVAPGENLFRIGLKYGMSWVPLAVYNNLPNPHRIYTGQVLRIPGGQTTPTPPPSGPESPSYINYTVKWGDTLFRISRAFGVSVEEIAEANGIMNPNLIYAGQVLKIPTGTPSST